MAIRYKEFPSRTAAQRVREAIDQELGLPKRGTNRGKPPHANVPQTYSPNAIGWTGTETGAIDQTAAGGSAVLLVLTDAAIGLGRRTVKVRGSDVSVDMTTAILATLPAKFRANVPQ